MRIFSDKVKFLLQEAQSINYRIRTLGAPTAVTGVASATEKITLPPKYLPYTGLILVLFPNFLHCVFNNIQIKRIEEYVELGRVR